MSISAEGGIVKEINNELTLVEFEAISDLIYRKAGIKFEAKKIYFLSKRIEKRVDALKLKSVSEYIRYLRFLDQQGKEFQALINLITVNETYFFRDFPQLQGFAEYCLTDVIEKKVSSGDNRLKIWCSGCSTGEEAYTISIILHEILDDVKKWDIQIIASDIDQNVLKSAQQGIYGMRSVKDVPPEYFKNYFRNYKNGDFSVIDSIKSIVRFDHLNLSDSYALKSKRNFDFIFCRNVLIYFDDLSRKKIVDHFYIALNKGGYVFLGSSESLGRISTAFNLKRLGTHLVYCKE